MGTDPKGYYADLGVSSSASIDEIKVVYRALVKIYHPDVNRDAAAVTKFRRITEAYEVLVDPTKRRAYDEATEPRASPQQQGPSNGGQPSESSREPIEPIKCSVCGKVTAQPRFLVFSRVFSAVLFTQKTPKGGIYCSECASRTALQMTVFSAALGWWGVPWGPIYTIGSIFQNAIGGQRNEKADEQLLWHNALAFLDHGKFELAGSLASELITATDPEIRAGAQKVLSILTERGRSAPKLKSPWRPKLGILFGHVALALVVPTIALLIFTQGGSASYRPYVPPYSPAPRHGPTPTGPPSAQAPSVATTDLSDLCRTHPRNNAMLSNRLQEVEYGHRLVIKNGSDGDAIIKVRDAYSGRVIVSFFASVDRTAILNGIPDGAYRIQFAYGDAMTADCRNFRSPRASEFGETQYLSARYTDTQVSTEELSFTLYTVPGGNVFPTSIEASAFNND